MSLTAIWVVLRKELTDGLRDRRSLNSLLIPTLFGPIMISFMFSQIASQNRAADEIKLPVVGRDNAPVLVDWLAQQTGVEILPGPADPETAVRDRKAEVVLVIRREFGEDFAESKPAPVWIYSDSTRTSSEPKKKRVETLLGAFSGQT